LTPEVVDINFEEVEFLISKSDQKVAASIKENFILLLVVLLCRLFSEKLARE
jgi:hypothetical protein